MHSRRRERTALVALLGLYLICAVGFALATPYGEAPDEYTHFIFVEHLVRFGTLPPIIPRTDTSEAQQPPLYYALSAVIVVAGLAIGGQPAHPTRLIPPIQSNPAFQPPQTSVAALRHPPDQRWLLWPLVLRGFSILLGLGVILLTYYTARALVPRPAPALLPLVATSFAALIPEANSIRASVSNENLADLMGAWIVLLLVLQLTGPPSIRRVTWLGIAFGLGLLTKQPLVLLFVPALWVLWICRASLRAFLLRDLPRIALPPLVLAGPYYLYLWIAYGDPLAAAARRAMMHADSPFHLTDLFWLVDPFRLSVWTSFWGVYGWQLIFMPAWIYFAFSGLTLLAVAGGAYLLWRRALDPAQRAACAVMLAALLLMYGFIIVYSLEIVAWQGRLLYPALSGTCVLFGLGLAGPALGPEAIRAGAPIAHWRRRVANALVPILTLGLFTLNIYSIVWLVLPALNS